MTHIYKSNGIGCNDDAEGNAAPSAMTVAGRDFVWGGRTYIMGILNVTPDSFSDGGENLTVDRAVARAKEMIMQGADIIDIGGESSRPGHTRITPEEESSRVLPVIQRLAAETDAVLSLDTTRPEIAEAGIKAGIHIINDIWGLQGQGDMAEIAARYRTPVIIMHNHVGTVYEGDMIDSIIRFLERSVSIARKAGIAEDKIILDPGLGFGKTPDQNEVLMRHLDRIKSCGFPVLLGASRKSMIGRILDLPPGERMEGTLATTVMGIMQGIDIVRVHDVLENFRAARVTDAIMRRK
jgi:dihydropteroate synthase